MSPQWQLLAPIEAADGMLMLARIIHANSEGVGIWVEAGVGAPESGSLEQPRRGGTR